MRMVKSDSNDKLWVYKEHHLMCVPDNAATYILKIVTERTMF